MPQIDGRTVERLIDDPQQIRDVLGEPKDRVKAKVTDRIDDTVRRFIAASPFAVLSTRRADGGVDTTPRGDPAGFAQVLDEKTLALPERPGNRRADALLNILDDPAVGLLFLIPGHGDTVRVSGRARIVQDDALSEAMVVRRHKPDLVVLIAVDRVLSRRLLCVAAVVQVALGQGVVVLYHRLFLFSAKAAVHHHVINLKSSVGKVGDKRQLNLSVYFHFSKKLFI